MGKSRYSLAKDERRDITVASLGSRMVRAVRRKMRSALLNNVNGLSSSGKEELDILCHVARSGTQTKAIMSETITLMRHKKV